MKSINLDEETEFYNENEIDWMMQSATHATKRDILRSAQNDFRDILEEFIKYKKKKFKLSEYQIEAIEDDFYSFLDYCEALVNEKGDTV